MKPGLHSHTPERLREISAMGGRAVLETSRTFYRDPRYAQEIGRRGGLARAKRAAERKAAERAHVH